MVLKYELLPVPSTQPYILAAASVSLQVDHDPLLVHRSQVGDVHGCYDQLVELLRKVQYKPRHDNLILVGDLVNKGPKSQQASTHSIYSRRVAHTRNHVVAAGQALFWTCPIHLAGTH